MTAPSIDGAKLTLSFLVTIFVLLGAITTLLRQDTAQTSTEVTVVTPPRQIETKKTETPAVALATTSKKQPVEVITHSKGTFIEVTDGCAAHFQGECLLVRKGPGKEFPVISKLRTGVVLKVSSSSVSSDGITWYKVVFDEWLRYPERLKGDWYVAADYVRVIHPPVETDYTPNVTPQSLKRIIVDRSEQKLYAYDGDTLFMIATTSTGLDSTPTPRGVFTVYRKTPSRYMQGPLPNLASDQYYDLPGVPWNLYFTEGGAVIHGAYWHNSFGTPYSHGCVNLLPQEAEKLYLWADIGMSVTVRD
jgi:hypothetical protein